MMKQIQVYCIDVTQCNCIERKHMNMSHCYFGIFLANSACFVLEMSAK